MQKIILDFLSDKKFYLSLSKILVMADVTSNYNMDAAWIQAGANLLGNTLNGTLTAVQSDKDRKFNTRVRAENRKWALEDYERLLQDSSPQAQVSRLRAAGLNPNLVYGSGNIQSGITSMPREADMPNQHYAPFQLDLSTLNAMGTALDLQLKKAEIKKINAETGKTESETVGQNLQNQFDEDTMQIRKDIEEGNRYKVMAEGHQIDNAIINGNLMLQKNLTLTDEQINTLIQTRFIQWSELELKKYQIGENIKQAWKNLEIQAKNADTAATNAVAAMIMAISTKERNAKLNELSVFQIGNAALEFEKQFADIEDAKLKRSVSRQNEIRYQNALLRFEDLTGVPYEIIHDLIPFAPNVTHTTPNPETGGTTTWKF